MVPLGEQKQEEVAQTYKTSCRYVTYSRFGKLCLIVKEYIVILFLKVIKKVETKVMTTEPQSHIRKHIVFLEMLQHGELLRSELLKKRDPKN